MLADFRLTSLASWQVALMVAVVAGIAGALLSDRLHRGSLRRLLLASSVLLLGSCIALGFYDPEMFRRACAEGNVIESLTAVCLLAAGVIATVSAVRMHLQGRPSPMSALLAVGFTWAFTRELEYGGNLMDGQFWFTRNFFQVRSFMGPEYFEAFRIKMDLSYRASTLYAAHICLTAAAVTVIALLAWYFIRHRRWAKAELRFFCRAFYGRLYLLGAGLFITAALLGGALHKLRDWHVLKSLTKIKGNFWHCTVEECVECWGAVAILFCAAAMWHTARPLSRRIVAAEKPLSYQRAVAPRLVRLAPHRPKRRPSRRRELQATVAQI